MTFSQLCALACRPSIAVRGLKYAVIVGPILIAINHGDAILVGELESASYVKMGLTFIVPYAVSCFSSVGAVLSHETSHQR
jgi:hypothetical protein